MSYTRITWVNKETKLNATNLNHIEEGLEATSKVADEAALAVTALTAKLDTKQDTLTSGTNIKTLNGESILGDGDLKVKSDIDISKLADYIRFGIFMINNEIVTVDDSKEIKLEPGIVYELSGCLKDAHILLDAAPKTDDDAANTQFILNNVYIESDTSRAIYCNQTKKKVVFTTTENSYNYITSAEETLTESKALIECEGNGAIVTGKDSTLILVAPNKEQHGIKMSRLYLSGLGTVNVDAKHDAFHGSKLIRIDSGKYIITNANDGFGTAEKGRIQVFGGDVHFIHCEEDGFDSQGARYAEAPVNGVIAGWTARVTVESANSIYGKEFNGMVCLETIPEDNIPVADIARTSLKDYFGEFVIKQGPKLEKLDFPDDATLATYTDVEAVDGVYTVTGQSVYIKGYTENTIECTTKTTTVYGNDVCINSDHTCISYNQSTKKLGFKGNEDAINIFMSASQEPIYSGCNLGFQKDANYLVYHKGSYGYAIRALGRMFTKGDGIKQFIAPSGIYCKSDIHFGIDKDDLDESDASKFELSPTYINSAVEATNNVYFCYSQLGPVIIDDTIKVESISRNYSAGLSVIETDKSATLSYTVYKYSDADLTDRFSTISNNISTLQANVKANTTNIDTLNTTVGTLTGNVSTLETNVSALDTRVAAKQDAITAGDGVDLTDNKLSLKLKNINNTSITGTGNIDTDPFTYTGAILQLSTGDLTYNSTENALIFSSSVVAEKITPIISAANNTIPVTLLCYISTGSYNLKFSLTYAAGNFTSVVRLVSENSDGSGFDSSVVYVTFNKLGLFVNGFDISGFVKDDLRLIAVLTSINRDPLD